MTTGWIYIHMNLYLEISFCNWFKGWIGSVVYLLRTYHHGKDQPHPIDQSTTKGLQILKEILIPAYGVTYRQIWVLAVSC